MHQPEVRCALIGCGLIGAKRVATLQPGQLPIVCDNNVQR